MLVNIPYMDFVGYMFSKGDFYKPSFATALLEGAMLQTKDMAPIQSTHQQNLWTSSPGIRNRKSSYIMQTWCVTANKLTCAKTHSLSLSLQCCRYTFREQTKNNSSTYKLLEKFPPKKSPNILESFFFSPWWWFQPVWTILVNLNLAHFPR